MPECEDLSGIEISELTTRAEKTANEVIIKLKKHSLTLVLAESCTAGLVSGLLANISGASAVLWGSYVCYKQEAKVSMLDLDNDRLNMFGLVSCETASSMAESALNKSGVSLAASVTGLAGSESDGRVPGGTIWIATANHDTGIQVKEYLFSGDRNAVRKRAAIAVLESILEKISLIVKDYQI